MRPCWLALCCVVPVWGAEAQLRDGSPVSGQLTWHAGEFRFQTPTPGIAFGQLAAITWPKTTTQARLVPWSLHLVNRDIIHVQLVEINAKHIIAETAWGQRLTIPRPAIARVTPWPNRQWHLTDWTHGQSDTPPVLQQQRATLNKAGQEWQFSTGDIAAGELYLDTPFPKTTTRQIQLEMQFSRDGQPATLKLPLADSTDICEAQFTAETALTQRLKRDGKTRRLHVIFTPEEVSINVDGYMLFASKTGAGVLKHLRIVAAGAGEEAISLGQILLLAHKPGKVLLNHAVHRDRLVTTEQTAIFGQLASGTSARVRFDMKANAFETSWNRIQELSLADLAMPPENSTGEHVAIRCQTRDTPLTELSGRVRDWTADHLELDHPYLGKLTIPRSHLTELRPMLFGQRIWFPTGPLHLGKQPVAEFRHRQPVGLTHTLTVDLPACPAGATLSIEGRATKPNVVVHLQQGKHTTKAVFGGLPPDVGQWSLPPRLVKSDRTEWQIHLPEDQGNVELRQFRLDIPNPRTAP